MKSLEEIFLSDYQYRTPNFQSGWLDSRIGLAPLNLRDFLKNHIGSAQQEIIVYNQSVTDNEIMKNLSLQKARWIHVEVCQSESSKNPWGHMDIPFFFSSGPYLHAKIFLIDGRDIFLWSANMTQNALDNNREIMVKIENNPIMYQKIKNLYNNDCKKQH
jgi:phosphatidylserine/phosphatidylglycerophosphate/cardiolipin synthase-like enzyme